MINKKHHFFFCFDVSSRTYFSLCATAITNFFSIYHHCFTWRKVWVHWFSLLIENLNFEPTSFKEISRVGFVWLDDISYLAESNSSWDFFCCWVWYCQLFINSPALILDKIYLTQWTWWNQSKEDKVSSNLIWPLYRVPPYLSSLIYN